MDSLYDRRVVCQPAPPNMLSTSEACRLKVSDFRAELEGRGLNSSGTKPTLLACLLLSIEDTSSTGTSSPVAHGILAAGARAGTRAGAGECCSSLSESPGPRPEWEYRFAPVCAAGSTLRRQCCLVGGHHSNAGHHYRPWIWNSTSGGVSQRW